jgi:uncharacterized protein (DUF1330 family)
MAAYLVVNVVIHDREKFMAYGKATAVLVEKMGGRYLVLGGARETLEGAWPEGKTVVSEWPSREAALAFWHSPEYAAAKKMREGISEAQIILVEGVAS